MLYLHATFDPERNSRFVTASGDVGTDLADLLAEARVLADRLECGIEFNFNGHWAWIIPHMDAEEQTVWLKRVWEQMDPWLKK